MAQGRFALGGHSITMWTRGDGWVVSKMSTNFYEGWVALLLNSIIKGKNKPRSLLVAISSLVMGPKGLRDTFGSFWTPTGSKKTPKSPRITTSFLYNT